jgi:deoxyribodipyrimidine photo-lyase
MQTLSQRVRQLNEKSHQHGPIVYWMNREMRLDDNWALIYAQTFANELKQPCVVIFSLFDSFGSAKNNDDDRMFTRMKLGLKLVNQQAKTRGLPFYVLHGPTVSTITKFLQDTHAGMLVTDFSPLRDMRALRTQLANKLAIKMVEVDAHNIVPIHVASLIQ